MNQFEIIIRAQKVMLAEAEAITKISKELTFNGFIAAVNLIYNCRGHIIITGMGKSGHIAKKIAASFASTGTPSFFIHPAEATHGDLGMITADDVLIMISYSGESEEILTLIPYIAYKKIKTIAITSNINSNLAKNSDVVINLAITKEACPYNLAPTVSTSAVLALGDALTISLMELKNFTKDDFSKNHPAGKLGKLLITKIKDLMIVGTALPVVTAIDFLTDAINIISEKRLGFTAVINKNLKLVGVLTDGDLRRAFGKFKNINQVLVSEVMTSSPKTVSDDMLAIEAVRYLELNKITTLLVTDNDNTLIGVIHIHDLIKMGFVD